jgi:epoxyqueuosine reductase
VGWFNIDLNTIKAVVEMSGVDFFGEPMAEQCGSCQECVEICPVQAFTGQPFREEELREVRYDASKCDRYFGKMKEKNGDLAVCGLCLYVCPHGRSREKI